MDTRTREILHRVAHAVPQVPAWAAVQAVLGSLGEALPFGTAAYLAANLPDPLPGAVGRHFPAEDPVVPVRRHDFLATVTRRSGCPPEHAESVTRAVTYSVARDVPLGVMADVRQATPPDLLDLVTVDDIHQGQAASTDTVTISPTVR